MALYSVDLTVEVTDPAALWRKARDYMAGTGSDGQTIRVIIGSARWPNVGACLAMLLDCSENLDGAEVQQHEVEEIGD